MDLTEVIEEKNKEYKDRRSEYLKTAEGRNNLIKEKIAAFTSKLLKNDKYQVVFVSILVYIFASGIYIIFRDLFSIKTLLVSIIILTIVYKKELIIFIDKFKLKVNNIKLNTKNWFNSRIYMLKLYIKSNKTIISGFFTREKR